MSLIRSNRNDRRRRVMREAVAADSEVAVESARTRQRRRLRERDNEDETSAIHRDPGYSQAVRRACQQRLVQLIPIRRSRLILFVTGCWLLWATLMLAHYFIHIQPIFGKASAPVALLVHLRSTHSISHWLGCQLWMLTALASLMIFQLRRHKLDDYRARYRVWGLLTIAALFCSFDVSSSCLYLIGVTMDGWAQREVGYSGWAIVLTTFATFVGILGLRICSEIKSAPSSVFCWLVGLAAWAFSALIGTKLIESPWSPALTDMLVGGTWLGGIMSVFLAAGIYLRSIYIQAQKRFILRNHLLSTAQPWKMPRFFNRRAMDDEAGEERQPSEGKSKKEVLDAADDEDCEETSHDSDSTENTGHGWRWLRWPRWRSDPQLGEDYSDVAAEQRKRDEGFTEPYGKKSRWFTKSTSDASPETNPKEPTEPRKSWWKRTPTAKAAVDKPVPVKPTPPVKPNETKTEKRKWFQRRPPAKESEVPPAVKEKLSRAWSLFRKRKSAEAKNVPASTKPANEAKPTRKRRLFGFLDALKLKPPTDSKTSNGPTPINTSRAPVPTSSTAQRAEASRPSTNYSDPRSTSSFDDDDYDDDSQRTLSKAERKRLRRQQQENRRAA